MEAAVAQLIKTAIIKAGNRPPAFAAAAQCGTAAATVRLLCVSPQPPGRLPKQPDGPPRRPGLRPALSVAAVPGRHAVSRVPFVKYLCGACCVPGLVPPIHGPMSQLVHGMLLTGLLSLSAATLPPSQPTRSPVAPASLFSKRPFSARQPGLLIPPGRERVSPALAP